MTKKTYKGIKEKVFNLHSPIFVEEKDADEESKTLTIKGYASTSNKDRQGDVILSSAWKKRAALKNYKQNPIILGFHDHSKPIGKMVEHSVDENGLHITAEISKRVGDIAGLIADGILRTLSVGFRVKDAEYDKTTDIFVIKDLELYEISVVSIPANPSATFSIGKAFDSNDEYDAFKESFIKEERSSKINEENILMEDDVKNGSKNTQSKPAFDLEEIKKSVADQIKAEMKAEKEAAEEARRVKEAEEAKFTEVSTGAERLVAEVTKRFETENASLKEALEGLRDSVKEKDDEIAQVLKAKQSKMSYGSENTNQLTAEQKDTAFLVAKHMKCDVTETKYFKDLVEKGLVEKSGGEHYNATEDWEQEFSMRVHNDLQDKLVVEPLFRKVKMNTVKMHIPVNPTSGYAEWIDQNAYTNTPSPGARDYTKPDNSSTGTAAEKQLTDITLTAYKLAAKERLGDEEDEDSMIPLMPIIRDNVVRKCANTADQALLLGTTMPGANNGPAPFSGLVELGVAATASATGGASATLTALQLQQARRNLGIYGLNPRDVVYVISYKGYYDLMEENADATTGAGVGFRAMSAVGDKTTLLTGEIGSVNGSRVIVSGHFDNTAIDSGTVGTVLATAVYLPNFMVGELRTLRTESERSVLDQQDFIVCTRRMGFVELTTSQGASNVVIAS